jgi:hypothetical protein
MTTLTALSTTPVPFARRIMNVVRLNVANPWTAIIWPWIILAIIFVANLAIWFLILSATPESEHADIKEGLQFSGASGYFFVYMLVVAVQTMNSTFPFALGYGVTRRDFYLGSAVTFVLLSAAYAVGMTVLSLLEEATGGWGLGGRMFTAVYFGSGSPLERLWIFFCLFMFFFFIGAALATVYVRWRAAGMIIFFATLGFLLIGAGALIVFTDGWAAIGGFFEGAGFVGSYTASLAIAAVAGVAGYLILQRATPRSA